MAAFFWGEDRPLSIQEVSKVLSRCALVGGLIALVISCISAALRNREAFQEWPKLLLYSFYVGAVFSTSFLACCGLPWNYLRPFLQSFSSGTRGVLIALIGAGTSMLAYTIASGLVSLVPDLHLQSPVHFGKMLLIEAVIGAAIALLVGTYKAMQRQIRGAEATLHQNQMRERVLSETAARAQALALQSQINPHFFFNTLNTLSAVIPINPEAAQEMVGRLAEMFRYTLACSRDGQVTLAQELAFVENYLNLEKARFSDRLRVFMPAGQFDDIHVPGLSLQPLVENAIKHGISKRLEGGEVHVSVHRNGRQCSVEVVNPAEPSAQSAEFFREGHALAIVRERLALHRASIEVAAGQPGRVCVSLLLPLEGHA